MDKFVVKDAVEIPKLGLRALRFKHKSSGLTHLHVQRQDRNRVFSLAFKTNAPDKTGVPHILEHTTLCGSEKYPVRDPFFKMQTRSLANFMNALTGTDYTYYPFATTNKADYENLQNVYMDSVFSPLLREQDFSQEGWRLEFEKVDDPSTPLVFKGVVFNEMKGQFSMPAYYFYKSYFQEIYPSLQYSAGDPLFIPDLTYENLVKFHHEKYHPDNCFTFSYGDFDADEALTTLSQYLESAKPGAETKADVSRQILQPVALSSNKTVKVSGPTDPMYDETKQHKVSLTWYVGEPTDIVHTLAWRVLGLLLTDGHASPFYQSLIDAGLASEFSVNTGLDETPAKLMFSIGLQGIDEHRIPEFKKTVESTLDQLIREGFNQTRIDAIIHQAELSDREIDANFGMGLLSRVVSRVFHPNDDVMQTLDNENLIQRFKDKIEADPHFFQMELQKMRASPYFEFVMEPKADFEKQLAAKETKLLEERVSRLNGADRKLILDKGIELAAAQAEHQDVSILPTVSTRDIPLDAPDYPVKDTVVGKRSIPVVVRETPTQGVSYLKLIKNISQLPQDLIPYLSVYSEALTNLGTKNHSMAELEDLIKLYTGGIGASAGTARKFNEPLGLSVGFGASGLDENLPAIYDILQEVMTGTDFANVTKLKSLLDADASNIMNSLSSSGHRYAVNQATAAISARRAVDERISGFSYVQLLKSLSQMDEGTLQSEVVPKFRDIAALPWAMRGGLTYSPGMATDHRRYLERIFTDLKASPYATSGYIGEVGLAAPRTVVPLGFQVSYVGSAIAGPTYTHKDSSALTILANLLTHRHLHTEIREKGGAYGGGSSYNAVEGLFTMYSYRDPSPENTLQVMSNAGKWAAERKWTTEDIEEGKIGVFQGIDAPISPRSEISQYLHLGLTLEQRQKRREDLLAVTPDDLNRVASTYLSKLEGLSQAGVCVIGPETDAMQKYGSWTTLQM